jgi:hypothetical protein
MKNFWEVPASNVIVTCTISDTKPDKVSAIDNSKYNGNNQFHIGPLLPGIKKRYWVFIENERYRKGLWKVHQVYSFLSILRTCFLEAKVATV